MVVPPGVCQRMKYQLAVVLSVLWLAAPAPAADSVIISEFMAANTRTLADEDGAFEDWIELYNAGDAPVNLGGWFLTDDAANKTKWPFPATNLGPNQFLVVFASNKDRRVPGTNLHTNFKLTAAGEYLALTRPDGIARASDRDGLRACLTALPGGHNHFSLIRVHLWFQSFLALPASSRVSARKNATMDTRGYENTM